MDTPAADPKEGEVKKHPGGQTAVGDGEPAEEDHAEEDQEASEE